MSDEQWGPWIEHDINASKPYGPGLWVEIEYGLPSGEVVGRFDGMSEAPVGEMDGWHRSTYPEYLLALRYRIRRPKGLTILENLIAEIPEEVAG